MHHYYFDIRNGQDLYPDEEGLELADQRAAEIEAATSLVGLAKDLPPSINDSTWRSRFGRRRGQSSRRPSSLKSLG
jgi:hypothetical protein